MSNKTQLQTNNTNLASLTALLRNKALPDSGGSSGGGGSVETCTVTFSIGLAYDPNMDEYAAAQVYVAALTVGNGARSHFCDFVTDGDSLTIEKNSFVAMRCRDRFGGSYGSMSVSNGDSVCNSSDMYSVMITSDCTITVTF